MSDENQERGSFISLTPVVDVSFLEDEPHYFLELGEDTTPQYHPWTVGEIRTYLEEPCRILNNALRMKGLALNTNLLLKMY